MLLSCAQPDSGKFKSILRAGQVLGFQAGCGMAVCQAQGKPVEVDPLLPDVLVFPPRADLHDHPLVQNGSLILQVMRMTVL